MGEACEMLVSRRRRRPHQAGEDRFAAHAQRAVARCGVVTAIENYGRVYRLLKANVPVEIHLMRSRVCANH
jgi:hypothetical protein